MTEFQDGSKIWLGGVAGTRLSEVPLIEEAVHILGNLTMQVVDDPTEAHEIVFAMAEARDRERFPDADKEVIDELAGFSADLAARGMEPSPENNHNPVRLVAIESADGTPVLPHLIYDVIKFSIRPRLAREALERSIQEQDT